MKNVAMVLLVGFFLQSVFSGLTIMAIKETKVAVSETITAYTPEDIIYLEGNHITSESGRYDIQCSTRSRALNVFEELTATHVNNLVK